MSDEVFPTPTRQIDIPARFIRQAMDHLEHTASRYVTFLFTGEQVIDAICVGVTTRLLITDQRRGGPPAAPPPETATIWTVANLTNEVILAEVRKHGTIDVRGLGNAMGIPGNAIPQRQRIRRVLAALTKERLLRKTSKKGAFPSYTIVGRKSSQPPPTMPLRPGHRVTRKDITEEKVMALIPPTGRISARAIGDALNIPRSDASVRGKVSTLILDLVRAGRVRIVEDNREEGGGRLYELINETAGASEAYEA